MKTPLPGLLTIFSLICFALLPNAQAVNPPPDGSYAGGNTAEGYLALSSLDTSAGLYNTAVGVYSLLSITNGNFCTALGAGTLFANTAAENTATGAGALFSIPPALTIQLTEPLLFLATQMAPTTQPLERPHFYSIRQATKTRLWVSRHSKTT
jgi:hypothetical protein